MKFVLQLYITLSLLSKLNNGFSVQLTIQKVPAISHKDKVCVRSIINDSAMEKKTGNNFRREKEGKLTYCQGKEKEADSIIHGKTKTVMFLHLVEHNLTNMLCKHEGKFHHCQSYLQSEASAKGPVLLSLLVYMEDSSGVGEVT